MNVYCDDLGVFEAPDRKGLQRLLMRVRMKQHSLIVADPEALIGSGFLAQAVASADRPEVEELLRRQAPELSDRGLDPGGRTPGPRAELVRTAARACHREGGEPVWTLDPTTAGDWAEAPLTLLMEDRSDFALVATAARVYGATSVQFATSKGYLRPEGPGGKGNVKRQVEATPEDARVIVLMDSDRTPERPEEGSVQRKVRTLCRTRPNVHLHVLAKREAENYIPEETLRMGTTSPEQKRAFRSWSRLSEQEKDLVDLEQHFGDKDKVWLHGRLEAMTDPERGPDRATLESRAGAELETLVQTLERWL